MKMNVAFVLRLGLALLALSAAPNLAPVAGAATASGGLRTDFALFDGSDPTSGETGAACGARLGGTTNGAVAFTYHVTVSNWSDAVKVLRVVYKDGAIARYNILPLASFSLTQAGGGTLGVDDVIRVFAEGASPSGLAGSMSILTEASAKPHPFLGGTNLCVTLTTPAP